MAAAKRPASRNGQSGRRSVRQGGTDTPRLDPVEPSDLRDGDPTLLTSRESHDGERFTAVDLTDLDLEGSSFRECVLERAVLSGARLRGSRWIESVVVDPFAPELLAARTTWRDVRIERPRWGSAELFDSEWDSVLVDGGKVDYLNLRGAQLSDVVIRGCSLGELDLGGVTADRVALVDCRIGTLDVTRASLASFDLRSSTFDVVNGLDGLRGVIVDDWQVSLLAPLLAAHVGLVVE